MIDILEGDSYFKYKNSILSIKNNFTDTAAFGP